MTGSRQLRKPLARITPEDLVRHPVWEFVNDDEDLAGDETWMRPVRTLPVDHLANRIVGGDVRLANGDTRFGIVGNLSLSDPQANEHFATLTLFEADGRSFDLARYHDVDAGRRGPDALARFLGLPMADVFPIAYDLTGAADGDPRCLRGQICADPAQRLSGDELVALALRS